MDTETSLPVISTSERIAFRRCPRKWWFEYGIRMEAVPETVNENLWFGTGYHYALADTEGFNVHGSAKAAFDFYVDATQRASYVPGNWQDLQQLAHGMLDYYYGAWLPRRQEFRTLIVDGVPQTEVKFTVKLPQYGFVYRGVFDRVVVDLLGRYWIEESKTASQFDTRKLTNDSQASSYSTMASLIYRHDFEGVVYTQHRKVTPQMPRELKNGALSVDKTQATTHGMYRAALIAKYGRIPPEYMDFLNYLATRESYEGDAFVRRDMVFRNQHQRDAEIWHIVGELATLARMRGPDNSPSGFYPNATRDCNWDCAFIDPCTAMDDGSDWRELLYDSGLFRPRTERHEWDSASRPREIEVTR